MARGPRQPPVPAQWRGREAELLHGLGDLSSELVVWSDVESSFTPSQTPAPEPETPLAAMLPQFPPYTLIRLR
ncbi:hypothetical protein ACLESO_05370 [Pyxidicoccus sp. 3LG]